MTDTLARPAAHPVAHAGRAVLRILAYPTLLFWAIVLVVAVVLTAIMAGAGMTDTSVVSYGRQAGAWFPFSMNVVVVTAYLRPHIAAGMTRRTFVRAALLVALAVAAFNAVLMSTLLLVERLVHVWLGWGWVVQEPAALDPSGGSWPTMVLDYGILYLVANLSGLLVGIVYYALGAARGPLAGGWWGTLLLPLTVGPVLVVLGLGALRGAEVRWLDPTVGLVTAIGLAFAVALAVAFAAIARRAAIPRPRT